MGNLEFIELPTDGYATQRHVGQVSENGGCDVDVIRGTTFALVDNLYDARLAVGRIVDGRSKWNVTLPSQPDGRLAIRESVSADDDAAFRRGLDGAVSSLLVNYFATKDVRATDGSSIGISAQVRPRPVLPHDVRNGCGPSIIGIKITTSNLTGLVVGHVAVVNFIVRGDARIVESL